MLQALYNKPVHIRIWRGQPHLYERATEIFVAFDLLAIGIALMEKLFVKNSGGGGGDMTLAPIRAPFLASKVYISPPPPPRFFWK